MNWLGSRSSASGYDRRLNPSAPARRLAPHPLPTKIPMPRLPNKVSLITGAAQGIGLATALKFASEGAIVIVCDVRQAAIDEAVSQCRELGAQAVGHVMDVTQRDRVDAGGFRRLS